MPVRRPECPLHVGMTAHMRLEQFKQFIAVDKGGKRDGVAEDKESRTKCLKKFVVAREFVILQGMCFHVPS